MNIPKVLITGSSGFIGFSLAKQLLDMGCTVVGVDNHSDYYDVQLKEKRLNILESYKNFEFFKRDIKIQANIDEVLNNCSPSIVVHLAAQAGVRYSIEEPKEYVDTNIIGTFNLLNALPKHNISHFLLASTSSAYGANEKLPYSESDTTNMPLNLYSASKISTEVMAHSYAYIYRIPTTVFRFFTVYGPWGRPDMALFKFTKNILDDKEIDVYGNGEMYRDFTYISDLTEAIRLLIKKIPKNKKECDSDSLSSAAPFRIVNIGNSKSVNLMDFINQIELNLDKKAKIKYMPIQKGDIKSTLADNNLLRDLTNFIPDTSYKTGVSMFINWYREFYNL